MISTRKGKERGRAAIRSRNGPAATMVRRVRLIFRPLGLLLIGAFLNQMFTSIRSGQVAGSSPTSDITAASGILNDLVASKSQSYSNANNANANANAGDYTLATIESVGFFSDIDNKAWKMLKERFQKSRPNVNTGPRKVFKEHANHPNYFWQENYDPEFTCAHEQKFGGLGDGGKWICDPHRIPKDDCLVYSIGSHGDFSFESSVFSGVSRACEIHTFDRDEKNGRKHFPSLAKEAGVEFHSTMLGESNKNYNNGKRFKEIFKDLKHEGKTVDILKIDCEGCEWEQYLQWIEDFQEANVTVRQILIEVHNSPLPFVVDFFKIMQEAGYVIFHKEANFLNSNCVEFSFVLLDKEFQRNES